MNKKRTTLLLVVGLVIVYGTVLAPRNPKQWEWLTLAEKEERVMHQGDEIVHTYQVKRWGRHKGKKHGEFTNSYASGGLYATGSFENGLASGDWVYYDKQGKPTLRTRFHEGKEVVTEAATHGFDKKVELAQPGDDTR